VLDDAGSVLQKGDATRAGEDCWEFPCPTQGKTIIAEAWDLAENRTRLVM